MTRIVTVPLGTLTLSQHNIRRTGRDKNIEQLAASIFAEGLLQNLTVARIPPDESQPAERYEVLAGGRRLRALQLLQQRDILPPALLTDVPVNIVAPEIANEVGIAENTIRETMHPHDEFVAFRDLRATGKSDEDIASRFGVSLQHVRRVIKIADVSPVLLRRFRDDALDLPQMIAFAISDDHAAQERVYDEARGDRWALQPERIRAALTQREVRSTDKRVKFVGLDAYEQAGGAVRRDLFDDNGGGYLLDEALLDQLVAQRLQAEADALKADGWSIVRIESGSSDPWTFRGSCDTLRPTPRKHTPEEAKLVADLHAERERLRRIVEEKEDASDSGLDEDDPDVARLDAVDADLETIDEACLTFTEKQKDKSGCQLHLNHAGELQVHRGLAVRVEGKSKNTSTSKPATSTDDAAPALADSMIRRLTAHRTLALQSALFARRDIALRALAHGLLLNLLYTRDYDTRSALHVDAKDKHQDLSRLQLADLDASPVMHKLDADIEQLRTTLAVPQRRAKFWPWLLEQNDDTILSLLALVAVVSLDATTGNPDEHPSDQIAAALGIDYADYWSATAERFGALVPKPILIEAVGEVFGSQDHPAATTLARMKKAEAAGEAERLLAKNRWLPKPLRRPGYKPGVKLDPTAADDEAALARVVAANKAKAKAKAKAKPAAKKPPAKKPTTKPKAAPKKRGKAKAAKKAA